MIARSDLLAINAKPLKLLKYFVDALISAYAVIDQFVDCFDHRVVHPISGHAAVVSANGFSSCRGRHVYGGRRYEYRVPKDPSKEKRKPCAVPCTRPADGVGKCAGMTSVPVSAY